MNLHQHLHLGLVGSCLEVVDPQVALLVVFFFFSLNDNFIEPWNYTRSTEDLRHVVRWHYIQRDPSYYNI